jgi:hypothetical protein
MRDTIRLPASAFEVNPDYVLVRVPPGYKLLLVPESDLTSAPSRGSDEAPHEAAQPKISATVKGQLRVTWLGDGGPRRIQGLEALRLLASAGDKRAKQLMQRHGDGYHFSAPRVLLRMIRKDPSVANYVRIDVV